MKDEVRRVGGNGAGVRIYKTTLSDQLRSWFIVPGKPHRQCEATHCGCIPFYSVVSKIC